jgi:hypothetical protein
LRVDAKCFLKTPSVSSKQSCSNRISLKIVRQEKQKSSLLVLQSGERPHWPKTTSLG